MVGRWDKNYYAFYHQKRHARERGILFVLTFEEWLDIWQKSGRLGERGRNKGQYCMARFGDAGPYEIGNVRIISNAENIREAFLGKKRPPEVGRKVSASKMGHFVSEATRAKLRDAWQRWRDAR